MPGRAPGDSGRRAAQAPSSLDARGRWLRDAPDRSYAAKLELFGRFAAPELRRVLDDLDLAADIAALDLGCGTGTATTLLAERLGPAALLVGTDLSLPHLRAARGHHRLPLVQSDAARLPFRDAVFDLIWACNSVNHLADAAGVLRALRRYLRPGGRVVVAQSGFLPEMFFAWDAALDDAVRSACHRYYRERYGLDGGAVAGIRAVVGELHAAGFGTVASHTYVLERTQPLSEADRDYLQRAVFEGTWGERVARYLDASDRDKLGRYCDPSSPDYCLDRDDFHHLQTLTVCVATQTTPPRDAPEREWPWRSVP